MEYNLHLHLHMQGKIQTIRQLTKILPDPEILYITKNPKTNNNKNTHKLSTVVIVLAGHSSQAQLPSVDLTPV